MPPRRWRMGRRARLTAALAEYLTTGDEFASRTHANGLGGKWGVLVEVPSEEQREALWREHAEAILADWIRAHPGTRPWGWWRWDAPEARRAVSGAELLAPKKAPTDWQWFWRERFGLPAFVQCRPRGYDGLPAIESQASYLRRLGLFVDGEGRQLPRGAYAPEEVDPFVTYDGELEELQAEGARWRAEEREQRERERADVALRGNGHAEPRS